MNNEVFITIRNDRANPHVLWIEPWGEDYTLLPGQELKVTVTSSKSNTDPPFELVETEGNTQIYCDLREYPKIFVDECSVECGYNRQAAIDAGIFKG